MSVSSALSLGGQVWELRGVNSAFTARTKVGGPVNEAVAESIEGQCCFQIYDWN